MENGTFIQIVEALAWPLAIAVVLVFLRRELSLVANAVGSRVSSIQVGGFQIELSPAEMQKIAPDWKVEGQEAGGLTAVEIFDSASVSLFEYLAQDSPADYVVVDLRDGEAWLTSRLFFFASVLGETRGIRAFVFVADRDLGPGGFVGVAAPQDIQRALQQEFSRLSDTLTESRVNPFQPPNPADQGAPQTLVQFKGASGEDLRRITFDYINRLQTSAPPPDQEDDWVLLNPPNPPGHLIYEYARWITPRTLHDILGDTLLDQRVVLSPDICADTTKSMILRRSGDFVASVDEGRKFEKLYDRRAILEDIAPEVARQIDS